METTIAALATAPAPAGLAVIRMSGSLSVSILQNCFKSKKSPIHYPRRLILGELFNPMTKQTLDQCLAVFMPAPHTFTAEDTVEINLHGSPLLARRVLQVLYSLGATPAAPGEFTKRAFLNGKLDLMQAEAVSDLIHASNEKAQQLAKEQLAGRFSNIITLLADPLRNTLAELEAHIDFPEEDIETTTFNKLSNSLKEVQTTIQRLINSYRYGKQIKEGLRVLIWGAPNAGKSSLLNQLLNEERAIVTSIPGTTRDLIEETGQIDGYSFIFCDSAGIQTTDNEVERIGIERAIKRLQWADLILFVIDPQNNAWHELLHTLEQAALPSTTKIIALINKSDLPQDEFTFSTPIISQTLKISAKTGFGLSTLRSVLLNEIRHSTTLEGSELAITEERHKLCLETALQAIDKAQQLLSTTTPLEILCLELRSALSALNDLIGITTPDDILGRIFSKFCIGK